MLFEIATGLRAYEEGRKEKFLVRFNHSGLLQNNMIIVRETCVRSETLKLRFCSLRECVKKFSLFFNI